MASIRKLVQLNRDGDLGKMLAEKFHGECGRTFPQKDLEFMIGFKSESETPMASAVAEAITQHYREKGFKVTIDDLQENCFQCRIHTDNLDSGWINVLVTTRYPLTPGGGLNHIRVTTNVIA